jgi:anti-sigma factor RsiW
MEKRLQWWFDGELTGRRALQVERHVAGCSHCARLLESWRGAGAELKSLLRQEAGTLEPLVGLQGIRERIERHQSAALPWFEGWRDLFMVHRRTAAAMAAAMVCGVLAAPLVYTWLAGKAAPAPWVAVEVESLEYSGNATAAVYRMEGDGTTIIWVEPVAGESL